MKLSRFHHSLYSIASCLKLIETELNPKIVLYSLEEGRKLKTRMIGREDLATSSLPLKISSGFLVLIKSLKRNILPSVPMNKTGSSLVTDYGSTKTTESGQAALVQFVPVGLQQTHRRQVYQCDTTIQGEGH